MDDAVYFEVLSKTTLKCEVHIQSVVSGWWPQIYWRHNSSIVNSTWPTKARIETNFWNSSVLYSPFPGSYQCVVDDGSFVLVSRVAQISLLCECFLLVAVLAGVSVGWHTVPSYFTPVTKITMPPLYTAIYPDPNPPQWHSVEACRGQLLHLPCQPLTADYQAQVFWRRNGIPIQEEPQQHTILQPGGPGDLVIYNFSHKDVGNYSCVTYYGRQIITGHLVTQSNGSCECTATSVATLVHSANCMYM